MRDGDRGAVPCGSLKCFLDDLLAFRVERARRFVENNDSRSFYNASGDGDALFLTTR